MRAGYRRVHVLLKREGWLDQAHSIADLERAAHRRLPRFVHDVVAGDAGQERNDNRAQSVLELRNG